MRHGIKYPSTAAVVLFTGFINTLPYLDPGGIPAGVVAHHGVPVSVILVAVALHKANVAYAGERTKPGSKILVPFNQYGINREIGAKTGYIMLVRNIGNPE